MRATTLFAAGLLAVVAPGSDRIVYAPELDAAVTQRFTLRATAELDELVLTWGGMDLSALLSEVELEGTLDYLVTDELLALANGRPERLRRTFDELSGATVLRIDGEEGETALVSGLEGATVLVAWSDAQGGFATEYEDVHTEHRAESLEGLDEDMSLRGLLPPAGRGELGPGATWEIPFAELLRVGLPGGYLALVPEGAGEWDPLVLEDLLETMLEAVREQFPDWASGHATATYAGTREGVYRDENEVDVIALELRVELAADLAPLLRELVDEWGTRTGNADEADAVLISGAWLEVLLEGRGELTWDRAAGRLQGFVFHGTQESEFSLSVAGQEEPRRQPMSLELEFHGTIASEIALE